MGIDSANTVQAGHLADIGRRELEKAYPDPAVFAGVPCEHIPGMDMRRLLPHRGGEEGLDRVANTLSSLPTDAVLRLAAGLRESISLQCQHLGNPPSSGDRKDVEFDSLLLDEVLAHLGGRTMSAQLAV